MRRENREDRHSDSERCGVGGRKIREFLAVKIPVRSSAGRNLKGRRQSLEKGDIKLSFWTVEK